MSWMKCHLCDFMVNTKDDPECWRKSVHPDKWTKPGQPETYPDIPLCLDCRERRDTSQGMRQAQIAGGVDVFRADEDIDGPSHHQRLKDVKRRITP